MPNINATSSVDYSGLNVTYTETLEPAGGSEPGINFSEMLTEALRDETSRMIAMAGVPSGNGSSAMSQMMPGMTGTVGSSGIEQMILASAASGDVSSAQMALFMLMMMMQSGEGGDMSMMSMMMGALLPQLENEAASFRNSPQADQLVFRMSSVNNAAGQAMLPLEVWKTAVPSVTSDTGDRSPERYRSVINQFRVETAERYRPFRDGMTYCNIFVLDVTRAMGAHIPHLGAIAMCEWLGTKGAEHGWREVDAETAQMHANQGKPAVTSAGSLGHVQMVCPSRDGGYDPQLGVTIAQAGSRVTNYSHISSFYSNNTLNSQIRYFIHD